MLFLQSKAQSNGDKLFMEGQTLQQTQTIAAQNQAIKKFKSAKVVYTTKEKKTMCDNQIAICNKNITSIKKGAKRKQEEEAQPEEKIPLSLTPKIIILEAEQPDEAIVKVTAATKKWNYAMTGNGSSFVTSTLNTDSTEIHLIAENNKQTIQRIQTVIVSHDEEKDTVVIRQKGKPVMLSLNSNLIEYRLKGGNKPLEIYTNSDSIINHNDGLTWYVESKPEWIEINIDYATDKKGNVAKGLPEDTKVTKLKLLAVPLMKSDPEYNSGRKGEIVFASQDKRYKVIVVQQK